MVNRWILFDLDGTLTQSEEGIWNCTRYAAEKMGWPEPTQEILDQFIGPPLFWSFQHLMGMTEEEALRAQGIYRERYVTKGLFENRVYPGIRTLLRTLKREGNHLGIVTGKPEGSTRRILEHFGLMKWIETVVCTADLRAEKDHLIRLALPEDVEEAWMVGDRLFDIEGGRKAGIHTLGVTYGYGSEEELRNAGAERIARSPREVLDILCPEAAAVPGFFLSMEGLDGSGKGTQLEALTDVLERFGFEVVRSREPGGTPIGEKIREVLLDRANAAMTAETEALLYAASRAQHVRETIRPAINAGKTILCDRFLDSSAAYQGGGRRLGVERVLAMNEPAVDGTKPDLTIYLEIGHREALARRVAASEPDRLELEAESFHARVEEAYHQLLRQDPERFVVVDAGRSREAVTEEMTEKVLAWLMEAE